MANLNKQTIAAFQNKILTWSGENLRDLPWRRDRDPYHILVSEIMLQQTQVARVIPKYEAWLQAFPTLEALAQAPTRDVLALWSGLGYNRRALNLQRFAQILMEEDSHFHGNDTSRIPADVPTLKKLPGIGEYTAGAVACFAFDQQIAVVDTNIRKVIAVEFFNGELPDEKTIRTVAEQLLPLSRAYEWNQALMDYSSAMLKAHKIPIPKQSKFTDSNRYYRGKIIRLLIQHQELQTAELGTLLKPNATESWVQKLIIELVRDKLIVSNGFIVKLP